jgi:hypothetical protein
MYRCGRLFVLYSLTIFLLGGLMVSPDKILGQQVSDRQGVLWEAVDISQQNLLLGPGGEEMRPDLRRVTFVEKKKGGYSTKYEIKDGAGKVWVAKVGKEAQSETAAVRLIWALGYKSEINYLVPQLTIPGVGTFQNVRLEARPDDIKRTSTWQWEQNPFVGTNELQGLKIMMALVNNWDLKTDNNVILEIGSDRKIHYIVSDLGVSFGKLPGSSFPLFRWVGRSRNVPADYSKTKFIEGVKNDRIDLHYNGKKPKLFGDITVENGRWLADLLKQLRDEQIADAFRAANYTESEINVLAREVKERIASLDSATRQARARN